MRTQLLPKKGRNPQFSAHVYCGQTAGWIVMPLSMEVGLGPGHIVLDLDAAPPFAKRGTAPSFNFWPIYCGHNRHGPKIGGCTCLGVELGSHLAQCGLGRGLSPCQVPSWSIRPFGYNRHGPKIVGSAPFWGGELGPHLTQYHLGRCLPLYQS